MTDIETVTDIETASAVSFVVDCRTLGRAVNNVLRFVASTTGALGRVHFDVATMGRFADVIMQATDSYAIIRQTIKQLDISTVADDATSAVAEFDVLGADLRRIGRVAQNEPPLTSMRLTLVDGHLIATTLDNGPLTEVSIRVCADGVEWPAQGGPEAAEKLWPTKFVPSVKIGLGQSQLQRILAVADGEALAERGDHPRPILFESSKADGEGAMVVTINDRVKILQMPVRMH